MAGTRSSSRAMLLWLALAGVVAVADQLIKQYILGNYRLGDDLKFVLITSAADLVAGDAVQVSAKVADGLKCERCWHYTDDVGQDATHPTLCGRCISNLFGAGETRTVA